MRIERIKEVLEEFEKQFRNINHQIEILEQKFKSKWFPKKKGVENIREDEEVEDPKDLRSRILLPE